jgi:hypothetical protein
MRGFGSDPKWRESPQASDEARCLIRLRRSSPFWDRSRTQSRGYGTYPECGADTRRIAGSDSPRSWSTHPASRSTGRSHSRALGNKRNMIFGLERDDSTPSRLLAPRTSTLRVASPRTSSLVWSSRVWEVLPRQTTPHAYAFGRLRSTSISHRRAGRASFLQRGRQIKRRTQLAAKAEPCSALARSQRHMWLYIEDGGWGGSLRLGLRSPDHLARMYRANIIRCHG